MSGAIFSCPSSIQVDLSFISSALKAYLMRTLASDTVSLCPLADLKKLDDDILASESFRWAKSPHGNIHECTTTAINATYLIIRMGDSGK